ncbi:hypothetical protein FHU42_002824 [Corynebacterium glutamicum]|nr:hypothetical protein [Corynebacterium glutamicum]
MALDVESGVFAQFAVLDCFELWEHVRFFLLKSG